MQPLPDVPRTLRAAMVEDLSFRLTPDERRWVSPALIAGSNHGSLLAYPWCFAWVWGVDDEIWDEYSRGYLDLLIDHDGGEMRALRAWTDGRFEAIPTPTLPAADLATIPEPPHPGAPFRQRQRARYVDLRDQGLLPHYVRGWPDDQPAAFYEPDDLAFIDECQWQAEESDWMRDGPGTGSPTR